MQGPRFLNKAGDLTEDSAADHYFNSSGREAGGSGGPGSEAPGGLAQEGSPGSGQCGGTRRATASCSSGGSGEDGEGGAGSAVLGVREGFLWRSRRLSQAASWFCKAWILIRVISNHDV